MTLQERLTDLVLECLAQGMDEEQVCEIVDSALEASEDVDGEIGVITCGPQPGRRLQ